MPRPPMNPELAAADPKGLIRESYAIEGIGTDECRSILIDWALSLPLGADTGAAVEVLLAQYEPAHGPHPMTALLHAARLAPPTSVRRGGRAGRRR